ncbi:BON domain-containing protein [Pedobacter alluvionis]|uniref:BON domain-containing protein n=1 Tax=Pedobacter alluvionis TaxID=475253 RepID=A0ABY2HHT5_9SPHI|nr:BON domain-containing protein [Pedobacter alluvionis]TFB28134.1 BON domain-containing protein [Pedobacter alluvionis]
MMMSTSFSPHILKIITIRNNEKLQAIDNALLRNWAINSHDIVVNVFGNRVTLSGRVHSMYQKDVAERIAWNAPGVWNVHNELLIDHATT